MDILKPLLVLIFMGVMLIGFGYLSEITGANDRIKGERIWCVENGGRMVGYWENKCQFPIK